MKSFPMSKTTILLGLTLFLSISCKKDNSEPLASSPSSYSLEELPVSASFNFNTETNIQLNINDFTTEKVKYYVFAVFDGQEEELIATRMAQPGTNSLELVLPTFCPRIRVERNQNGRITSRFLEINAKSLNLSFSGKKSEMEDCKETLYAVNGQGGFYALDVESGTYASTALPNLVGGGSIACAVNKDSNIVYYNTGTTLRYYDYNTGTFHVAQQGNPFNGSYPRMEYNRTNGLLYIARNEDMYIINPLNNAVVSSFDIVGLEAPVGGGDVAIADDGTIFMCCFSGLYRIEVNGSIANATRISAENLPFQPTSMAIDRNDRLYLATNDANAQLIEMDKVDGAWSVVQTYNHKINDLGSYKCDISQLANIDSDNDGIIDAQDDFPNDPNAAHAQYTPSDIGWGSLSFEDLWPSRGDYDFNDLVVNYRFTQVANANNQVVRLEGRFRVKAIGASFRNGFGFKLDVDPNLISSVSGFNHTDNIVSVDGKGLEAGHSNGSTIIVFDDAFDNIPAPASGLFINTERNSPIVTGEMIEVIINFTNPIDAGLLGNAPFNPFIFINGDRGREVHLADKPATDLANASYYNTGHDDSDPANNRFYRTENNLPWAINIIQEFRYPVEKVPINNAYNFFNAWALSSGASYSDWYKDNAGYREDNDLILN
jgi:LruC domain-containing protein